ncbi:hypothetical protein DH2020_014913 [Rehmannia glutinosa]|uniref:Disease resistance protein n=1 Tax=Rehmannia glutinosa TaxID=99300 RepID=A0ABR0WXU6_REHGL
MVSYAAVVSLKQTIERLLNFCHISINVSQSREIIELAYNKVKSLQEVAIKLDGSSNAMVNAFDGQIREAARELEDALESHVSNHSLSQSKKESLGDERFSEEVIKQEINTFIQRVKKLKKVFHEEIVNWLTIKDDDSKIDFGGKKQKLVGLSDNLDKMMRLLSKRWSHESRTFVICGMAGIGKTTLAKEIFEDQSIRSQFDCRVWVTLGPTCSLQETIRRILTRIDPDIDLMLMGGGDEELHKYLHESLKGRRYLIVLDDIWNVDIREGLKQSLPDDNNGSRVLLTTRISKIARGFYIFEIMFMSGMSSKESWYLLRELVFGEKLCPPELEKAGKKIAENCEGHPLTVLTIGDFLSKADKTPDYWNKVAQKENSVFNDSYDKMLGVLFPSYQYLPQYLKACFLYMGVFPEKYEIPVPKLIMLWIAEGFLEPDLTASSIEEFAMKCLTELNDRSLFVKKQVRPDYTTKTCHLHSVFWHLCRKEARKNKFFHVINSYADSFAEATKNQRGMCIHKNIFFGIKDVYNSMASNVNARSLLCTGPHHPYPVPIFDLRLLRVLDALTIPFYEFPIEILNLIHLRYIALTLYNGNLPSAISKLWNLQFLIVCRHLSIKSCGDSSFLPMEIWDMIELKHLEFMGSDLPVPCGDALLPNLLTLLDVSARSCTKGVLKRIPNLMKLGIQIELELDDVEPFNCFDYISHLHSLESLKCVVVNPRSEIMAPPPVPLSNFPSRLTKLTLSGLGYPWKEMSKIASLPKLKALKLRCHAFRGPKWETYGRDAFARVEFLLIEDNDLVNWTVGEGSFPYLETLRMKHCYKLEEIPYEVTRYMITLNLVDCNPLAVTCAKEIQKKTEQETGLVFFC